MLKHHPSRVLVVCLALAICLFVGGCGGNKLDGLTQEEAEPILQSFKVESAGEGAVNRLEAMKLPGDIMIVRMIYTSSEGKKEELLFRFEKGNQTGRTFNDHGDQWRSNIEQIKKEFDRMR